MAEASLRKFIEQAWPIVEPGTKFVGGRHINAIVEHLEAVTRGEIRNLLINVPPRSAKSLIVAVFWPCWEWTFQPETRWLFASYAEKLSIRDSLKCRRILESPWYRRNWGDKVRLTDDQNAKGRFENSRTGHRISTSCGGATTGEGGDRLVVDDPHNVMDAFSDVTMEATVNWFDEAWTTRINDQRTGAMVVIMQRISEKDLSAHLIRKGGWEHLMLPMRFDPARRCVTGLGWEDWRKSDGELLWPERVGESELRKIEANLGRYGVAGQLQQAPTPRGGGMFEQGWFEIVDAAPADGQDCRYWDRAGTENDGDWTCGLLMRKTSNGLYYVLDVERLQGSALTVEARMKNKATQDREGTAIVLEQDPGQAGKMEAGYHVRQLAGFIVRTRTVTRSKEARAGLAGGVAAQAEAGNVKLVRAAWNKVFLDEVSVFPRGKNDDQVDALSGAFNELANQQRIYFA